MRTVVHALALLLIAAAVLSSAHADVRSPTTPATTIGASIAADCTVAELKTIARVADTFGGILAACQRDTGFRLVPFATYPRGDLQLRVCFGRSCPTAISSLQDAKLPNCLLAIHDDNTNNHNNDTNDRLNNSAAKTTTPAAYLKAVCTFDTITF